MQKFFAGRMNRSTYLIPVLVGTLAAILYSRPDIENLVKTDDLAGAIAMLLALPLLFWQFSTSARRVHDIGFNGWYALAIMIPGAQFILLVWPGNKEKNKYGASHKQTFDLGAVIYGQSD